MTVLLDSLSVELAAAGERQARRVARRRRRARLAAAVAVALLGLIGAAVATGAFFWQPQLGNESQGHPTASPSDVPAAQLEVLSVLRRPQTEPDRGAASQYAARWLGTEFRGVRTNSIRLLSNGAVLFSAEHGPAGDNSLCLFLADTEAGGFTCVGTDQLRRSGAALITVPRPNIKFQTKDGKLVLHDGHPVPVPGSKPSPQPARVIGIVPDGVAAIRFGDTTVPVDDNAYDAHLAPGEDPRQTLLDRDGNPWHGD
jgi:hypothetical protein